MSRRNQTRRRRTYGRRQHEVRERREDSQPAEAWMSDAGTEADSDWQMTETEERTAYGEAFGGFSR